MVRYSFLLAAIMMASSATAGECPAEAVPIQIIEGVGYDSFPNHDFILTLEDGTVKDVSHNGGRNNEFAFSAFKNANPHFSYFVKTVTKHVADRLGKENLCINNHDSRKRSLLQFVNWRLFIGREKLLTSVPSIDRIDNNLSGSCRVVSPWIDIVIGRSPVPWVRGVVRWNQRQLLADQAILDGASNVPPGVAMPLTQREFFHFAFEYADSEIDHVPATAKLKPIAARVPADLMWLFRRAVQTTRWPFDSEAMVTMRKATEKSTEKYTALTIALIDRCFASDGEELHYSSILDAADLISLKQYKIDTPFR